MLIIHWIFFVVSVIIFIISLLACFSSFKDEDEDASLYGTTSGIISTGLLIYSSFNIFSSSTAHLIMWSLLAVLLLSEAIVFFRFIKSDIELSYKIIYAASFLLTVAVGIIIVFNSNQSFCLSLSENSQPNLRWISLIVSSIISVITLALLISLFIRMKKAENMSHSLIKDLTERNELFRNSVSDSVSNEASHKLYELYQVLMKRSFYYKNEASIRDMVSFYLNDLKLPVKVKDRIIDSFSHSIRNRQDFTFSEFQDIIISSSFHTNTEISLDNRYFLEEIVDRTKIVFQDELRKVLNFENSSKNESINNELHEIKELISKRNQDNWGKQSNDESVYGQYIRELFHSLMTPISQIEISTDIVKERIDKSDKVSLESLDAIDKGVKLLYAFLFAYRQVVFAGYASNSEDKLTINEGIDSAKIVYESNLSKKVSLQKSNVPNEIKGLSNNFVLAILLPLLENAVYATNVGQEISIEYKKKDNDHIFTIQNPVNKPIIIDNLYKDGFSSKTENGKPHIGIGLSAVRALIEKKMGSSLHFNLIENEKKLETILTIKIS